MKNQHEIPASRSFSAFLSAASISSGGRNLRPRLDGSRRGFSAVRGLLTLLAAFVLLGAFCELAKAQVALQPGWYQQPTATNPGPRFEASLTYDTAHNQVVLFSGNDSLNDTWLWNGSNWSQAFPASSPSARFNPAMVFDAAHGQVVLFGGQSSTSGNLSDTWLWNGINWTQASPTTVPSGRDGTVMVYDAAHSQVLMFGGNSTSGIVNDTWVWNGSNWTSLSPANSPSARADFSMAYDAAHGEVILFGGEDVNGNYLSDTWAWNGTTWTLLSPSTTPSARYAQGMAYNAAIGQVVMFGGLNSSGYLSDTWTWNGSNWIQQTDSTGPSARIAPNGLTYDSVQGQVVLYSGLSPLIDTWEFGTPGNFGNVNVCPSGQVTPAPCSSTLSLTYSVATNTTFNPTQVLTLSATGLDFQLVSGSTCTGTVTAGSTCTLNVTFAPTTPGLRSGAVELFDNSGNLLTTTPIYGVGEGPAIAFGPGTQTTIPTGVYPFGGVAVDGSEDVYVATYLGGTVLKVTPGGVKTTIPATGLTQPIGVALDGAGNVYIVDRTLSYVVKLTPGGVQTTLGSGLTDPHGIAVDGAGNVYVADRYNNARVLKITPAGAQTAVPFTGLQQPYGVAVDGAGDVFVADDGTNNKAFEITPAGVQTTVPATGLNLPGGIAVDAAGDIFIADSNDRRVVEVPAGGVSQITLVSGLIEPIGLALDSRGNVFIGDQGAAQVYEINRSQYPSLSFASTYVGSTSSDSPQSVTLQNIGNQTLNAESPGFIVVNGPNFSNVAGTGTPADCSTFFTLSPGADCNLSIDFTPQSGGNLSSTAVFSDNVQHSSSSKQTVSLSGTGLVTTQTLTLSGAGTGSGSISSNPTGLNCNLLAGVASGACSSSFTGGSTVSLQELPAAGSTFTGWGGACASFGTSQTCTVQVNAATNVTATFIVPNPRLSVTIAGTGFGSVTDDQFLISCSQPVLEVQQCSNGYPSGSVVNLLASPTSSSTFVGWGGSCANSGTNQICTVTVNSSLNVTATFVAPGPTQAGTLQPITAGTVYGQGGSFASGSGNNGGVSANSISLPGNIATDSSGNLYLADAGNNRVLFYPAGSTTSTLVYGQSGSFTSNTANNGGVSANSFSNPAGVAVDSNGNVYVADTNNNRVLYFPSGASTPTQVYGQGGSFTSNTANNGGVSANSLNQPTGVAVDSSGNLYVADTGNNRVLFYSIESTTASQVYGQNGSFASNTANDGGIVSTGSLYQPTGVALDPSGDLYIADKSNNRVLFFPVASTTATQVYGQGGSFVNNSSNYNGVTAASLSGPTAVSTDASGNLYITDTQNNRVLFYPVGTTTATRVYGQLNSLTASGANNGGISANSLSGPKAVALDLNSNLYVLDSANSRVLEYGSFGNVNVCPTGATTPAPCNATIAFSYYAAANTSFGATQVVTQGATGRDFTLGAGGTCVGTVAAGNSCTVDVKLVPASPGLRTGAVKLFDSGGNLLTTALIDGIGQAPLVTFGPGAQNSISATGLVTPVGVAFDGSGNLYVADYASHKVVKIEAGGGQSTVAVAGLSSPVGVAVDGAGDLFITDQTQASAIEITPAGVQTSIGYGLSNPYGIAVDGQGNVYIGDENNNQVVKVTPGGVQTVVPATGLNTPQGVAVDAAGNVYIADVYNTRVVKVTPGGVQTTVPASGLTLPYGVGVDAAGDVYIADSGSGNVWEVAPNGTQTRVGQGLVYPSAVTVDGSGNVYIGDQGLSQPVEVNRSQLPSLSYGLTNSGASSSPQTFSIQNVGNQPLTGSLNLNLGGNFTQSASPDCSAQFPLAPGAGCSETISFTPQTTGYLTGTASFSDNTLNLSQLVVLQTINFSGNAGINGQPVGITVPNLVGLTQVAATAAITNAGLTLGTVSEASSSVVPSGSVTASNPAAGTQVMVGSAVRLLVSSGQAQPPAPNPLSLGNNYFVTGDYASAGVTLRGHGVSGTATGTITIPSSTANPGVSQGIPDGADIIDAFLYWETLESTPSASSTSGTFNGYSITGQQIGKDLPSYVDGTFTGTLRAYRADVNTYFPVGANGVRFASGSFTVSLPDGGVALPLTEGASLVVIYRVLSPNFPLKSVVIYDGAAAPTVSTTQTVQGFYDALGGGAENTILFDAPGGGWNNSNSSPTLAAHANQYSAPLNSGSGYVAVIVSTPVTNSDNDGILDAWKAGPAAGDFYSGQPGYYDVKTGSWVPLPGAAHGQKDLFVQLDYMCGGVLANGSCDPSQENLFPSPDSHGNDPLAIVTKAFAADGMTLHLQVGNAVPEDTCADAPGQLCQFPNQPGVVGWKNSLELSKVYPRNLASCAAGGDCTPRFAYGQKDSYHYVLFSHSLAIPAWNTRYGTLTSITVANGVTTIVTTNRGASTSINYCPSRITLSGVLGNPSLNGVYNTTSCPDAQTIIVATPSVPNWSYPNSKLPEPVIGLTSGTVTSISGYSDLGGADSAISLGLWETAPNQDMSKRSNVIAGTLFHEIGHTLGLSHGGLYYNTAGSYLPTFDVNCKPNYQSSMNYLFQLDGVGPTAAVAFSNQTLKTLNESSLASVTNLTDGSGNPATFSTSAWYTPIAPSTTVSPATLHCDGTPLAGDTGYREFNQPIAPITPAWSSGQNIAFDGVPYSQLLGYNDVANIDLRQVGATGGEFASEANVLSFGSSQAPLTVAAGGTVALGSGGTVALGSGGTVTLGSGGNVTLGSGGTITLGSGGTVTLGSGGNVTVPSGGVVTAGSNGTVALGSGGTVTLGSGGTITLGSGGTVALGSGGTVTLGSGGTIALGSGGNVTIPSSGGSYTLPSNGGTVALGSGGTVTLGSGGTIALGSGGTIALGSGGTVALGSGGTVTLGSGGTVALGSGGTIALGSGGNVTLGSGGTIALGSGGNVTLGSGGNVTLGSGGNVTLGSGGNVTLGSGGNVTLGSGGTVTLGSGGTIALGSGGNVTLGSGGNVTLGSGGTIALGSGGTVTLGSGGTVTLGSGGTIALGSGGVQTVGAGTYTIPTSGGTITLGSGGTVTLGSGGTVALGSGGTVTLGSGGTITLGSGGTVTLGSGGNVTLGSGGVVALGSGGTVALGSGGTIALGSGGTVTLGSGGASTNELTYETANSIVRPPSLPTETKISTTSGSVVVVNWTAPAFGVVSTYTISRSSDGGTPIVIGSVSGVNGNPPATSFTDTNPDLTSQSVVYTISTTLLPVAIDPTQRQSAPSAPAILTNSQTIVLGALPSSVTLSTTPLTVTATAESGGSANGLQVMFSATGSCSVGSQSLSSSGGVSSALVTLSSTGSCTIVASQPGTNLAQPGIAPYYSAANSVSGTFSILSQGSNLQSQTINFNQLPNVQYGSTFSLSATSSASLPISFTTSGPCTASGAITGIGVCSITASAPANNTYSAASVTQSFCHISSVASSGGQQLHKLIWASDSNVDLRIQWLCES